MKALPASSAQPENDHIGTAFPTLLAAQGYTFRGVSRSCWVSVGPCLVKPKNGDRNKKSGSLSETVHQQLLAWNTQNVSNMAGKSPNLMEALMAQHKKTIEMVDGNQPCLMLTNVTVTKLDPMRPTSRRRRFLAPKFRWWCYLPEKNKENSPKKGDELLFYFFGSYYRIIHIYICTYVYNGMFANKHWVTGAQPTEANNRSILEKQKARLTSPKWRLNDLNWATKTDSTATKKGIPCYNPTSPSIWTIEQCSKALLMMWEKKRPNIIVVDCQSIAGIPIDQAV
jgi:hypothetical protein